MVRHMLYAMYDTENFFRAKRTPMRNLGGQERLVVLDLVTLEIGRYRADEFYRLQIGCSYDDIKFHNTLTRKSKGVYSLSRESLYGYRGCFQVSVDGNAVDLSLKYSDVLYNGRKVDPYPVQGGFNMKDAKRIHHIFKFSKDIFAMGARTLWYLYRDGDSLVMNYMFNFARRDDAGEHLFSITVVISLQTGEFLGYCPYGMSSLSDKLLEQNDMLLPTLAKNVYRGY